MYFSLLQYVALSAVIINLMCAGLLTVLLLFVPFVRERKLQGKYAWSILGCIPACLLLPLLRDYGNPAFTFYHTHMLLSVVALTAFLAVRCYGRQYPSPLPFLRDSWPVCLSWALWVAVAVLARNGVWSFGDSLLLSGAIVLLSVVCGMMAVVTHLRLFDRMRCASAADSADGGSGERCESYEKRLFLKTMMVGEAVMGIVLALHWVERTEATFIAAVTVFTIVNMLLTVLLLVNDTTAGEVRLQYADIQRLVEREIGERDAYYMQECRELCRRIDAIEAERKPAADGGRGREGTADGRRSKRPKRKGAHSPAVKTVESQILDTLKTWIELRGYCRHNLSLDGLAAQIGTNRSYLSRCINAYWGMGFSTFLTCLRVREACRLMSDDVLLPMTSVAYRCGFNDGSSFTRCFKQVLGIAPTMWKQRCADPDVRSRVEALGMMKLSEGRGTDGFLKPKEHTEGSEPNTDSVTPQV